MGFEEQTFAALKAGIIGLYRAIRQIERIRLTLVHDQPIPAETADRIATVLLIWQTVREAAFLAEHAGLETWRLDAISDGLATAVALMDAVADDLRIPRFTR